MRTSQRIPIENRVKVTTNGRTITYVMALNLSQGGILLNPQTALQVGSSCEVTIPPPDHPDQVGVVAKGTVVRNDAGGTAVKFASSLAKTSLDALVSPAMRIAAHPILEPYRNYFRVSQSQGLENCESLLGVTKSQFRTVFYSTFIGSIILAILPVWLLRASIPDYPNLVKIALAFLYGAIWMAILQPSMDLAVFHYLRTHSARK